MPLRNALRPLAVLFLLVGLPSAGCDPVEQVFDFDSDGVDDADDCSPEDPSIHAGADDPYGDGIDQDCDGFDGVDRDQDGYPANVPTTDPAWDCNDADGAIHPGAAEIADDNLDQDCDGADLVCDADGDLVLNTACGGDDCDDDNGLCFTEADCTDADGDTFRVCDSDCDDGEAARFPANPEVCDGLDNDCNAEVPADEADDDGDGFRICDGDCDDDDDTIHPDAAERCDGLDTDCDGELAADDEDADGDGDPACSDCDEDDPTLTTLDLDGDGHLSCGYDCDDSDATIHPLAFDALDDGIDSNCDEVDGIDGDGDGEPQGVDCDDSDDTMNHADLDGDGTGTCDGDCDDSDPLLQADDADFDGFSTCAGDCDDAVYAINPAATEECDLVDNDCDGVQDADEADGDGDGDPACSDCDDGDPLVDGLDVDGDGASRCDGDCDDLDATIHPLAFDALDDGIDSNCDEVDGMDGDGDGEPQGGDCDDSDDAMNHADLDGDGAGTCDGDCDDSDPLLQADDADFDGFSTCTGDCDDTVYAINPAAAEVCDLVDNDCDGVQVEEVDGDGDGDPLCNDCDDDDDEMNGFDVDGDGFSLCDGDCDDDSIVWNPVALDPLGDGVDTNCDGDDGVDSDGDGVPSIASGGTDCDDTDPSIYPGAEEINFDGIDQDCDGLDAVDGDGDGYVDINSSGDDGDDDDDSVYPGAPDDYGDGVDQDCDDADGVDDDGDGWGSVSSFGFDCDDTDAAVHPGGFEQADDGVDANCDGFDGMPYDEFEGTITSNYDQVNAAGDCDLDGDGQADLAIGETYADWAGGDEGAVWIFFGPLPSGVSVELADVVLFGADDGLGLGSVVECAGDADGDGFDDLYVDSRGNGGAFLFLGPILGDLGSHDAIALDWVSEARFPGDLDGDGVGDAVLCYHDGIAYCDVHPAPWADVEASTPPVASLQLGITYARMDTGDFNGDGDPDLLVGASGEDFSGPNSGVAWLFEGPLFGTVEPSDADATFVGPGWTSTGVSVGSLGDLDGNGLDDLFVATGCTVDCEWSQADPEPAYDSGLVSILLAPFWGSMPLANADNTLTLDDEVQRAVGCDLNGDGAMDLTVSTNDQEYSPYTYFRGLHHVAGPLHVATGVGPEHLLHTGQTYPSTGTDLPSVPKCAGDLDGEGEPDLLLDGWESVVWIVPNPAEAVCTTSDVDGDGTHACDGDCDDLDPDVGPDAVESTGDGVDSNCDGVDGVDADGDGEASIATGGLDCDDTDVYVGPEAIDVFGDGVDQDCDGVDALDADGDGEASIATGGLDCADADPDRNTGETDLCEDGIDQDCDGLDTWCPAPSLSLSSDATLLFVGTVEDDEAGERVVAGDFNGDGVDDLVIAVPGRDGPGGLRAGILYVFNGPLGAGPLTAADADASRWGDGQFYGVTMTLAVADDVDGDGDDELLVGMPRLVNSSGLSTGGAALLHGPITGNSAIVASAAAVLYGEAEWDLAGISVASGDFDGDGIGDLVIGSKVNDTNGTQAGSAYVVYGPVTGAVELNVADARLRGDWPHDFAGAVVASAGDTDGDGVDDLLVTAREDDTLMVDAGATFLILGPITGEHDLSDVADARILGTAPQDIGYAGTVTALDVDGDGLSDVVQGTPGLAISGSVRVFYGPLAGDHPIDEADGVLTAPSWGGAEIGTAIAPVADYDGDGFDDLLIAARSAPSTAVVYGAGAAFLARGPVSGTIDLVASCPRWEGTAEYEYFGEVLGSGDLDDDGVPDLLFGQPDYSESIDDRGAVYVVFGSSL